jgi:hypothetical protein
MGKTIFRLIMREGGFAFVEAALTTVVLSVGLWGSLMMMSNVNNSHIKGDLNVIAGQLAAEKLEVIIADKTFTGYGSILGSNYPAENLNGDYKGFTRSVTITEVSASDLETPEPGSGLKLIEVDVSWGDDSDDSVGVTMLVSDYS